MRRERKVPGSADTAMPATRELSLQQQGDVWSVEFGGRSAVVRDSKGLQMLAKLIDQPEAEIHVLDLSGISRAAADSDEGPILDSQARDEYRRRVSELKEELEDAESMADLGRVDALRTELDFITRELSKAFGLGGRKRAWRRHPYGPVPRSRVLSSMGETGQCAWVGIDASFGVRDFVILDPLPLWPGLILRPGPGHGVPSRSENVPREWGRP